MPVWVILMIMGGCALILGIAIGWVLFLLWFLDMVNRNLQ